MTISFRLRGLLSFALATHHILHHTFPTVTGIEMLLLCAYGLIWASKPYVRASTTAFARHLERYALVKLPATVIHRYKSLMDGSFYVLLWILIWGPTSGLPKLLRSAWWSIVAAFTICYVSAILSGFLWVPALCYVGHPSYNVLQRAANMGAIGCRRTGTKVRSLFKFCQAAAASGYTYGLQHRPTLSGVKMWATTAMAPLRTGVYWAACAIDGLDAGSRSTIAAMFRATSVAVDIGHRTCSKVFHMTARMHAMTVAVVSQMHSTAADVASQMYAKLVRGSKASASWASSKATEACSTAQRLSRQVLRASVNTAAFFRKEPGTVDCIVASTSQILEGLGMASEVLSLIPFAVLSDGDMLKSGPTHRIEEAVKATVEIALIAPFQASNAGVEADCRCEAALETTENEDTAGTLQRDLAQLESPNTLLAQQPINDHTDDDLDALIRSLATLVLSDPDEQPTSQPLGPYISLRIPVSAPAESNCFDLAPPPRRAPTPCAYSAKDDIAAAKGNASSYDSFNTTLCGDSCASPSRFLDSKLHEQASGDPMLVVTEEAATPKKSAEQLKVPGAHKPRQTQQDLAKEVRGAMLDTISDGAIGDVRDERETCRGEEIRVGGDTPAAKQLAWRALLTYGRG